VIFRNIKHAIFQPVENDLIVLLHFTLYNPIMVGNKKS
jgi:nucleosome binding factor SPN SPT16 subunit